MSDYRSMGSDDLTRSRRLEDGELYCPTCDGSYPSGDLLHCPNDGTKLVRLHEAKDPLLGRNIEGRFVIKSRLGAGGMGAVYLALQGSVGREVAIKVIESRLSAGRLAAKRFLREAKLSSRLQQPNTVTVLDFGQTEDGLLYLVMELVKGKTLGEVLATEGRFSVERMAKVGIQLCDALEAAHRLSIIHRDLKPSNVILLDDPPGRDHIKVLDFGLAKSLAGEEESTTMTQSDAIMGTPSYIPPEAVIRMQFDARSDLYSLGVILYELLTGELPFSATTVQTMLRQHAYDRPKPLPQSTPPQVQLLLERMLEKDPDRRHQSAVEVRDELHAVLAAAPLGVSRPLAMPGGGPTMARPGSAQHAISHELLTTQLTPLPFRRRRPRRWPWVVAVLATGAATAAAIGASDLGQPGVVAGPDPALAGAPPTAGGPVASGGGSAPAPSAPGPAAAAEIPPAVARKVQVTFDASPPAIVWVGEQRLGRSPQTYEVDRSDEPLPIRFERTGYRTLSFSIRPQTDLDIKQDLEKLPEAPRRPAGGKAASKSGGKSGGKSGTSKPAQTERPSGETERPGFKWVKPSN
jgi:hypothetical protein